MEQITLDAATRESSQGSTLRRLRETGRVPAVLYGHQQASTPISVPIDWIERQLRHGHTFVKLQMNGQSFDAFVRDIQRDPVTKRIVHLDFYRVDMNEKMEASVPVHLYGVELVERKGGIIQQQIRQVSIRALPSDTPEFISVNVSHLNVGDSLCAREIHLPNGMELRSDENEVIASALAPRQVVTMDGDAAPSE